MTRTTRSKTVGTNTPKPTGVKKRGRPSKADKLKDSLRAQNEARELLSAADKLTEELLAQDGASKLLAKVTPEAPKEGQPLVTSDGSTASYYELPKEASQLQDLISYKNMNGQLAEIFRAAYRYGEVAHSDKVRDIKKIMFYAKAELDRLALYETGL